MSIEPCKSCKGDGFKRLPVVSCGCREAMCPHYSPFDYDQTEREAGIYWKFWVRRTDGSSRPGGKHEACEYFVLDWHHDPFAAPAALAYAAACEAKYPELAADLRRKANARVANQPSQPTPNTGGTGG